MKEVNRIVMGWNAFANTDTYINQSSSPNLHVVSPRWYTLNSQSLLKGGADPQYVQWAHDSGKQVWPLLGNRFDPVLTDTMIGNEENRKNIVQLIKESLLANHLDGINIDFENVDIKNKEDFVSFVRELGEALHPHGLIVSVDVTRENPDPFWSGSYDRSKLGEAADYIIMMGYDEHWSGGGKAGSVSSLPWVSGGIQLLMKEVPSQKIILGVPFYTREWITDLTTGTVTSYDRSMTEVEQIIREKGLTKVWDAKAYQNYVEFKENGEKHQIWVEDETSMKYRRYLVNKYCLRGVAAWYIGQETPDIWNVFDPYR